MGLLARLSRIVPLLLIMAVVAIVIYLVVTYRHSPTRAKEGKLREEAEMGLLARLSRIVPLLLIMAVVAIVIYLVVTYRHSPTRAKEVLIKVFTWLNVVIIAFFTYRHSPTRAKEVLIKVFTWLNVVIIAFFGLASLYALFESHVGVLDLALSFAIVGLVCLGITRWCNHVFLKHNPHYRDKRQAARVIRRFPWKKG